MRQKKIKINMIKQERGERERERERALGLRRDPLNGMLGEASRAGYN